MEVVSVSTVSAIGGCGCAGEARRSAVNALGNITDSHDDLFDGTVADT